MSEILKGIELVKKLSLAFGPTGCEGEVREAILSQINDLGAEIKTDKMGNMCALVKGSLPSDEKKLIMISAHMDEVGFMVNHIDGEGYINLVNVGGIDDRVIAGKRIIIKNERGEKYNGVICIKAIHHRSSDERSNVIPLSKMYATLGCNSKEEAEALIDTADFAVFDSEFVVFGENGEFVKSKALDDRMGCAAMIEIMRKWNEEGYIPRHDVLFAFTVREETGLSGAGVVAHRYAPDYSIVLECTAVADLPNVPAHKRVGKLGDGGAVSLVDRSTIYPEEMISLAMNTAEKYKIKAQIKKYVSGGNDAGHIHKSGKGVKTLAISVPTRYLHSAACVASYHDYEAVRDLAEKIITEI